MINDIYDSRLLPEKLTKFPYFTRFFAPKMPDYIIRRDQGHAEAKYLSQRPKLRGQGQIFEAEAKILAART